MTGLKWKLSRRIIPMTVQTLPGFCFIPAYDVETDRQQFRIVIKGLVDPVPTNLIALNIFDQLKRRLGDDRDPWTAMTSTSIHAEENDLKGGAWD